ncbi:hypothetical protein C1H46_016134 [Malus baccata]|uniref:Uncharacterized protein n=1 Tax=Malus baccata TaxID=106549 RepID=A0A540MHV9_MALBA|nr:hypothetical protein C1H46_016134 [Malus baccata]
MADSGEGSGKKKLVVPEELKKSMLEEFSVHWDVDETNDKQRKYLDELYKKRFQQWKFDVLQDAE